MVCVRADGGAGFARRFTLPVKLKCPDDKRKPGVEKIFHCLVTNMPEMVETWISNVCETYYRHMEKLVVGLEIQKQHNTLATLQLTVGDHCLLYQVVHATRACNALAEFLMDNSHHFVTLAASNDGLLPTLEGQGLHVRNLVLGENLISESLSDGSLIERKIPVHFQGWKRLALYCDVMESELEEANLSGCEWTRLVLDGDEVGYAASRAICAFRLGMKLFHNIN